MKTATRTRIPAARLLLACVSGFFPISAARAAATDTWTGAYTNSLSDPNSWLSAATPLTGDSLVFGLAGASGTALTNDLASSFVTPNLTFNSGAPAYTITGNAITLGSATSATVLTNSSTSLQTINDAITLGAAAQTILLTTGGGNVTLGGILSGAGASLVTSGAGVLTLSGANTFNGGVTLNTGTTLNVKTATSLGTSAGTFIINGGTLDNTSASAITTGNLPLTVNGDFAFTGTNNLSIGVYAGGQAVTLGTSASASRTITVNGGTLAIGGNISSTTSSIIKNGLGALSLLGSNGHFSTTVNAGTLNIGNVNSFGSAFILNGSGSLDNVSGGALVTAGLPFTLNGASPSLAAPERPTT